MKHFLFFYYIITAFSGILGYFGILFLWLKYHNKYVFYYFILFTALSLSLFTNLYQFYRYILLEIENFKTTYFVSVLFVLTHSLFFLSIPAFIFYAMEKEMPKILKFISRGLFLVGIIAIIISIFSEDKINFLANFDNFFYLNVFYVFLIYNLFLIKKNLNFIKYIIIKEIFSVAFWLTIFFIPLFMVDSLWSIFQIKLKLIPRCFNFMPLYYFLWNIIFAYYLLNYITRENSLFLINNLPESFIKSYKIGKRETEIINMIIQGLDNKEIADKLFISESTVRNHISNIYRKVNISNKVELLKLIQQQS